MCSFRSYVKGADLHTGDTGILLRPWHLAFSPNAGLKGYVEPVPGSLFFSLKLSFLEMLASMPVATSARSKDVLESLTDLICGLGQVAQFHLLPADSLAKFFPQVQNRYLAHPFCLLRFRTDSNLGATEKLSVCLLPDDLYRHRPSLKASDVSTDESLADPLSLLFVKGWTRSFGAITVMLASYENDKLYEASPSV